MVQITIQIDGDKITVNQSVTPTKVETSIIKRYFIKHTAAIKKVMKFGYTKDEAINILNGLNPNGSKMEELPF